MSARQSEPNPSVRQSTTDGRTDGGVGVRRSSRVWGHRVCVRVERRADEEDGRTDARFVSFRFVSCIESKMTRTRIPAVSASSTIMAARTMRMTIVTVVVLVSAFAVATVSASSVVPLTLETLERDVLRSREPWMVSLTADADKCPACEMIEKEFAKASVSAGEKLGVKFGSLNVLSEDLDMEKFESLVRLQQLPAILAYPTHATLNPYDERRSVKLPETFPLADSTGRMMDVSARTIAAFADKSLPSYLVERVDAGADGVSKESIATSTDGELPKAVLLTNKKTTSSLLKAISHALEGRMRFVEVYYEGSEAPQLPGVEQSETTTGGARLVVYPADASAAPIPLESDSMKREVVLAFLTEHAGPEVELKMEIRGAGGDAGDDAKQKKDQYASMSILTPLKASDFTDNVLKKDKMQFVVFSKAEERCASVVEAIPRRLRSFEGVLPMHEVIVPENESDDASKSLIDKFGIFAKSPDACVELLLFPRSDEEEDREVLTYSPASYDIEGYAEEKIASFFDESSPDLTIPVTAKNMDQSFFGLASTAPRVLLFAEENDATSRALLRVMAAVNADFIFGVTSDMSEELKSQFQVKQFPSLVCVYRESSGVDEDGQMRMAVQRYPHPSLMQPVVNMWISQLRAHIMGADADVEIAMPKTVDTSEALDEECASKGGLCVVALIKGGDSAQEKIFHAVAKALYGKPFHFAVVDPTTQRSFASVFDVNNPVDYPTVTVFTSRQLRYATHKGAFEIDDVKEFCEHVLSGKVKTWRFQEMPKLIEGGEKVEEIIEEEIEEEFDLSDIMGEEIEGDAALSREELAQRAEEEARKAAEEEEARKAAEAAAAPKKKKKKSKKKKKAAKTEL